MTFNQAALEKAQTTQEFLDNIEKTYKDAVEIVKKKNQDYASSEDPFKNFRYAAYVGVSVEDAILVRISDKLSRCVNLLHKEDRAVHDEGIEDTIIDVINYFAILKCYIQTTGLENDNNS